MELDLLGGDVDYRIKDDTVKFEFLLGIVIWSFFYILGVQSYWDAPSMDGWVLHSFRQLEIMLFCPPLENRLCHVHSFC